MKTTGVEGVVSLTGLAELDKKLEGLERNMQRKALRQACRAVAKMVHAEARATVPRLTGALAKSLVVRATPAKQKRRSDIAVSVMTKEGLFRGDQFYGGIVELGSAPRQTKAGANRGIMPEFRFLRNALYSYPATKLRVFQDAVRKFIETQSPGVSK